ncbi:MAG: pseudouridylate synthase [Candidatus Cryptobacteroides sp.]
MERQFSEEYLRSVDVHTVLPQQEPFVMVGSLIAFDAGSSVTETVIREDNIFVDDGCFSASGMMENIAQTCAARVGFYNKYVLHKDVQVGFIGAVRDYVVHSLAPVGETVTTRVDILEDVFGMTLANASVSCGGKVIAEAQIKLAVRQVEE